MSLSWNHLLCCISIVRLCGTSYFNSTLWYILCISMSLYTFFLIFFLKNTVHIELHKNAYRNLVLLKLSLLCMTPSMCLRRHSACASQLLLFYLRTRASLIHLIQMELVLHGYQRKIFPTMQKNLRKQALLEDLTTTDAWTGMCLMVSQQFWFCNLLLYWCYQSFAIQQFPVFYLPWDNWKYQFMID